MKAFKIVPEIIMMKSCAEFSREFSMDENDLVITSEGRWERYFKDAPVKNLIFIKKYGSGEPNDEMAEAIAADIKYPYKRVIAIGGGTILDVAKLFALEKTTPVGDLFDKKIPAVKNKELILVPTTCGTGSEVTNISILEFKKRGTKFGLADDALYADKAVLIPELMIDLPFKFFAASSIDALIHSVESYLSPKASDFSQNFSKTAIRLILNGYKEIAVKGQDARKAVISDFCMASAYAGIAFGNAGCAAVHAMSYPLGARYHVPHGESNYAVFTGVFRKYMEKNSGGAIAGLNAYMADILGCRSEEVYDKLELLLDTAVLEKQHLHEYGMTEPEIEEFADSVISNQQRLLANNYVPLSREDIVDIYTKLF